MSFDLNSSQRKLKYNELFETVLALEEQNASNEERLDITQRVVGEARQLVEIGGVEHRSKHPGEGLLDARVLHASSNLAKMCLETVDVNINVYDPNKLAEHIKTNPDVWDFLYPYEVPSASYVYGASAMSSSLPSRRSTQPRTRAVIQNAQMRVPKNVERVDQIENGPELVSRVHRFVKSQYKQSGNRPLSYYNVLLDPHSYSRTVENIYYLSFLVHDGLVAVEIDESTQLPFITPRQGSSLSEGAALHDNQLIVSLDMKTWKELVEAFDIKEPLMVIKRL